MWEVVGTDEFADWYGHLTEEQAGAVDARVDLLEVSGPSLGRPTVDTIKTSRHPNMKELRCSKDGALRILFYLRPPPPSGPPPRRGQGGGISMERLVRNRSTPGRRPL